jgi:hypothetical protein
MLGHRRCGLDDRLAHMGDLRLATLRLEPVVVSYDVIDGNITRHPQQHFLDLVVDGTSLRERVEGGHDMVTALCRTWDEALVTEAVEVLLGRRGTCETDAPRVELLVCKLCGDVGCGTLTARLTLTPSAVTWSNFLWEGSATGAAPVEGISEPFVFERDEYEAAFVNATERVAAFPYDELAHRGRRFLWPWQWGWRLPGP